ncbi:PD-(D/E)XK nuclease family protein [Cellulophaga tyrosinoxydans]|uniref:PD-(D/E)XK nuclease superfamily protein n=1 Tax=Cellulophaga tyrosinoxydans TaxID=504486 RepID=A0A1W1ZZN8_9FLAO|nr:PD-(D/E)XK nuclease family protein [Cellulophaga tyrosinoxydans]SMC53826.1 PD-(D/E)XK nuclease superfamily protein [Cellulophaga tyrosinoxydans]
MTLPSFFIDDSNSDKFEETIDFFMSWTIRCADVIHQNRSTKVYYASRNILAKLLLFEYADGLEFSNIKVWKQHKNIDLWIELNVNNEAFAIIIENKMYSKIHSNQLQRYKEIAQEHYANDPNRIILYILLRPDYTLDRQDASHLINTDFHAMNLEQLADNAGDKKTGNDLFDEFWFNWAIDSEIKRGKK